MDWHYETGDAIGELIFSHSGDELNTLGEPELRELEEVLELLEQQELRGLLLRAEKPDGFIAGADIHQLNELRDRGEAYEASRTGQRLFQRLADLPYPTLAAVHGTCLGGGFELALACDHRVVSDHEDTELGFPEVKLGILPGWGGTQRLPRLVGLMGAIDKLLQGRSYDAAGAVEAGVAQRALDPSELHSTARTMLAEGSLPCPSRGHWSNWFPVRWYILRRARKQTLQETHGNMPAPLRIIEVLRESLGGSLEEGLEIEAGAFADLAMTRESENLIRVFFLRRAQRNRPTGGEQPVETPERVGVIGAGTMGSGIAHWVSSRGHDCVLLDVDDEALEGGMQRIRSLFDKGLRAGALEEQDVEASLDRIRATTAYPNLRGCDLVVEAVVENIDVKRSVFESVSGAVDPGTVIATNTSALSLEEMAGALPDPGSLVGLHFFNPVYRMPLIEVVEARSTGPSTRDRAVEFVKSIGKVPVVVKDRPGFLVNRVLAPYLNEAGRLLDEGYRIEDVDRALVEFGMPMGPLRLLDEVGIDVAYDVADYLAEKLDKSLQPTGRFRAIHESGLTGTKGGEGFYRYNGDEEEPNPDCQPENPRDSDDPRELVRRTVNRMIGEAVRCLEEEIVAGADELDIAMILGTGFAPFRGGLLKHADDYGLGKIVSEMETYREIHGDRYRIPDRLREFAQSGKRFTGDPAR